MKIEFYTSNMTFYSLNHFTHCWTNQRIFIGQIHNLAHILAIGMRILSTCSRANFIDLTIVIRIKKKTW